MGCGSSKAVAVANAPQKVVVASAPIQDAKNKDEALPVSTSTPVGKSIVGKEAVNNNKNSSPGDSGLEVQGIITEDTAGGEEIAADGRPITPELELSGVRPAARHTREPDSDIEADETLSRNRDTSAVSTRSAPIILQRPSSRGGSAFDISFDAEQEPSTPGLPKRLQQRDSSGKKKREELTLEELQSKLQAADQRRKDIEARLKAKMASETAKAEQIRSANTSVNESLNTSVTETSEKEKQALDNREAHLRQLRERLRAKEERARQVREKKKALASTGGTGSSPALTASS